MTSKKYFSNLIINGLRNNIWSFACSFVVLFLSLPIYGAITLSILDNKITSKYIKAYHLIDYYTKSVLGESNDFVKYAVAFLAVIIAFNSFSYLFSKQKVDMYHSLAIKREILFLSNFIAGIITFVIPYIITAFILAVISRANSVFTAYSLLVMIIMFFINLIGFIGIYSVTVLAIMLTGRIVVSILAVLTLFSYGPLLCVLSDRLHQLFFYTFSNYNVSNINFLNSLSIVKSFFDLSDGMNTYSRNVNINLIRLMLFTIASVLLILLDIYLYKKRSSESAGNSISFPKMLVVISTFILTPGCIYGGILFNSFVADNQFGIHYSWFIFGLLFTLIISHFIIQAIIYCDFKSMFKKPIYPCIAGIISCFVIIIFQFDLIHYDNLIIKEDKIDSIAISCYRMNCGQDYFNFDEVEDYYGNSSPWLSNEHYLFDNMQIRDYDLISEFLSTAISNKKCMIDDDMSYLTECSFSVKISLKNGKKIYRNYCIPFEENMELLEKIYTNQDFKKGIFSIFNISDNELNGFSFENPINVSSKIPDSNIRDIIEAYKEELLLQDGKELESSVPIGFLYKKHIYNDDEYTTSFQLYKCYIYPSFTKTISLLKKSGVDFEKYMDVDNISSIVVTTNNENNSDDYSKQKYTDRDSIKTIYEKAVSTSMSDTNGILFNKDTPYVEIYFTKVGTEEDYSCLFVFKKDSTPDIVKKSTE